MVPISFAETGLKHKVIKVASMDKVKKHLENLGIYKDAEIEIISNSSGVIILKIKDGRVAINQDLATKIFVE